MPDISWILSNGARVCVCVLPVLEPTPSRYITSESHVAGTPGDFKMAAYVRDSMRKAGLDANIMEVETLLSYPADRAQLEIIDPPPLKFTAALSEDLIESDPTSDDILRNHTYNGYEMLMTFCARMSKDTAFFFFLMVYCLC